MLRIVGVIIFVIGLALVVLGILKIVPGAAQSGFFAVVIGGVVFGLSFVRRQEAGPEAPPPLPATERVTAIFYEPARVFQNLRWHPRWLAAFLVMAICAAIYHVAFVQRLTPEFVALAPIEKTIEGGWITGDRADQAREQAREAAQRWARFRKLEESFFLKSCWPRFFWSWRLFSEGG